LKTFVNLHDRIGAVTSNLRETPESASMRRSVSNLIRAIAGTTVFLGCSVTHALASPISQDVAETDLATASVAASAVVGELWSLLLLGTGLALAAALLRRRARSKLRAALLRRPA
jgi:hypothetical protein